MGFNPPKLLYRYIGGLTSSPDSTIDRQPDPGKSGPGALQEHECGFGDENTLCASRPSAGELCCPFCEQQTMGTPF